MSILFKNCSLLVREEQGYKELKNAYLGVDGKLIDYISVEAPKKKYDEEKDMSGKLLIPGLTNAHGHSAMTLVRAAGSGLPLQRWLNEAIFPIEAKMTEDDIAVGTRAAMLEMLACGTTNLEEMYDFPWAEVPVIEESGMKVRLGRVLHNFDPVEGRRLKECQDFYEKYNGLADGRVQVSIGLHSEYLTVEKQIIPLGEWLRDSKCPVHVHVSETKSEHEECMERHGGLTPVQYFNKHGILEVPVTMAHCVWVTDEDLKIMAAKGSTIAHNPTSNLKLGSGIARIGKAVEMGVNVALGTDGVASNNNLNMFEEMHLAALLQKGVYNDPTLLTDAQVFDMATINGAKAVGQPNSGVLAVGKCADIVAVDMDKPHLKPNVDSLALMVFSAQGSDVCMTMVDGRILYENGEYKTLDKEKVEFELQKAVDRLMA